MLFVAFVPFWFLTGKNALENPSIVRKKISFIFES